MKKINILKIDKIVFTDTAGIKMIINNISVEKLKSPIEHYRISGHNGNENCSGADVGIELRYVPNSCAKEKRHCCSLSEDNREDDRGDASWVHSPDMGDE